MLSGRPLVLNSLRLSSFNNTVMILASVQTSTYQESNDSIQKFNTINNSDGFDRSYPGFSI